MTFKTALNDISLELKRNLYRHKDTEYAYKVIDVKPIHHLGMSCAQNLNIRAYDLTKKNIVETLGEDDLEELIKITENDLTQTERKNLISLSKKKK